MKAYLNPYDKLIEKGDERINECTFDNRARPRLRSFNSCEKFVSLAEPTLFNSSISLPLVSMNSESLGFEKFKIKESLAIKMKKLRISSFNIGRSKDIDKLCCSIFCKDKFSSLNQVPTTEAGKPHIRKDCFGNHIMKKGKGHKICFADSLTTQIQPFVQIKKDVSFSRITRKMNTLYDSETSKSDWNCLVF